jgi:hypothetical protein
MEHRGNSFKDDPLGFNSVDREIRINKLKQQLEEISGGEVTFGSASDCDPDVEEAFLEHVLAFESEEGVRPFDVLKREGFDLTPPQELTDDILEGKLLELIDALARYRLYLERTDHLSSRELYSWLWNDVLREEYTGLGVLDGDWHVDVLGGCSEEDLILSMRFYSTPLERARWAKEFPDFPMPPMEKPPYDRDRHLPHPEPPF